MNKEKVIETLESLPSEFKTEELIDRLLFIEKVEQGMMDVQAGRTLTIEQAKERLQNKMSIH